MRSWLFSFKLCSLRILSRGLSNLPSPLLYLLSGFVAFILYRVIRYRKSVVNLNLRNSFPEKSEKEISKIEHNFYKHLADTILETIIIEGFSKEEMQKRMIYYGIEEFEKTIKNRSAITAIAHYGAWEYTIGYSLQTQHKVYAVYHPLTSKLIDEFLYGLRSKFGTYPIPMASVGRHLIKDAKEGVNALYALIADQTPPRPLIKNRMMFLNQSTAFFNGIERLALTRKMPVFFLDIKKVKRGHYTANFIEIYDGDSAVDENEITKRYVAQLEKSIIREPYLWMWSHKRWKHAPLEHEILV